MVFGAYPQGREADTSLERPFLDENGAPNELSKTRSSSTHELYPNFLPWHVRKARLTWCRATFIALACVFVIAVISIQSFQLWKLRREPSRYAEVLGELNGIVPTVRAESRLFAPNLKFDPLNMSDPDWEKSMPIGGGFVSVPDWQSKTLPPIQTHGKDLYNVAVFHQLHCLHVLAEQFDTLLGARNTDYRSSSHPEHVRGGGDTMKNMEEEMMLYHIRHCLGYLKSSLMCCADTALEGQKKDIDQPAVDGFGSIHVCRNFGDVFKWAENHRGTDQTRYPH